MKKKMNLFIVTFVLVMALICPQSSISYTNSKYKYKIEYNGLIWVALYRSIGTQMKWINFNKLVI